MLEGFDGTGARELILAEAGHELFLSGCRDASERFVKRGAYGRHALFLEPVFERCRIRLHLREAVGKFDPRFGHASVEKGDDVLGELGTLEASERADRLTLDVDISRLERLYECFGVAARVLDDEKLVARIPLQEEGEKQDHGGTLTQSTGSKDPHDNSFISPHSCHFAEAK